MILAIFVIAVLLIAGGLLGFYGAINLIPTDLGLAYFHAGTLSLVAGLVTMALGFAARANVLALRRVATPAAFVAPLPPATEVFAPQPEPVRGPTPSRDVPLAGAAMAGAAVAGAAVAGAAVAGGAALAASSLQAPASPADDLAAAEAPPVPTLDQMVLDLPPVDLPAPVDPAAFVAPEPEAVIAEPEAEQTVSEQPAPDEPAPDEPAFADPVPDEVAAEKAVPDEQEPGMPEPMAASTGAEPLAPPEPVEAAVTPELPPIPDLRALRLDPIPGPPLLSIEQEIRAELNRKVEPLPEPAAPAAPEPDPVPAPASPVPGLIADADLAALEQSAPPLAPLETLEVVGSYDSGGTRFTMYSDGSVVASGPEGETRYPTLQDLRRHLDQIAG